jgi:hypothetical protein
MRGWALAALLVLPPAAAVGVNEAGPSVLEGHATDLAERLLVVDLWDEGQPARGYALRVLPDGDDVPGLEARARPVRGAQAAWQPFEALHVEARDDARARERGWDGLYELGLRVRLPNVARARLALALVEDAPGSDALAISTDLHAALLALRAELRPDGDAWRVEARVEGGKAPSGVEAWSGEQHWALAPDGTGWTRRLPDGVGALQLRARFADGGVLDGPRLEVPRVESAARPGPASPAAAPEPAPGSPRADAEDAGAADPAGPNTAPEPPAQARGSASPAPGPLGATGGGDDDGAPVPARGPGERAASSRSVPAASWAVPISLGVAGLARALLLGRRHL